MTLRFLLINCTSLLLALALLLPEAIAANKVPTVASLSNAVEISDWRSVRIECSRRLKAKPTDVDALAARARLNLLSGKRKDAIADCDKALSVSSKYPSALFLRGVLLADEGKLQTSKRDLLQFLNVTAASLDIPTRTRRGHAYEYLNDFKNAKRENEAVLKDGKLAKSDMDLFFLGQVQLSEGKLKEGQATMADLLKKHVDAPFLIAQLAHCDAQSGKTDSALNEFAAVAKQEPNFSANYSGWGSALERQNFYNGAIQLYDRALQIDHRNFFAIEHRGLCNSALGNYKLAIDDLNKAVEYSPGRTGPLLNRAFVHDQNGQFKESVDDCTRAIALNSQSAKAWYQLACARYHQKMLKEAKDAVDKALALSPKYPAALCERAWIVKEMGDKESAYADFAKAIQIDKNNSIAYYSRGFMLREDKQYEKSISDLSKAIELDPLNAVNFCARGCTKVRCRKYKEAVEDCTQSIKLDPERSHPFLSRGQAYLALEKYDWAVKDLSKAIERYDYVEGYRDRAAAYFKLNKPELARRDLEKVKQLKLAGKD